MVRDAEGRKRVGRFSWKADTATLEQFVAEAFRNELGVTSPLAPDDLLAPVSGCTRVSALEDDGTRIRLVTAYIQSLSPLPSPERAQLPGQVSFDQAGCAGCHAPTLPDGRGKA